MSAQPEEVTQASEQSLKVQDDLSADVGRYQTAVATLVELASKDTNYGRRQLFDYEKGIFNESSAIIEASPDPNRYFLEAIRAAIKTQNWEIARMLLAKDRSHEIFKDVPDILQLAIRTQCTWFYRWRDEEPALRENVELYMSYSAAVDSLDAEGNTPLYYTCTYGHSDTFRLLVDSGAGYDTLHNRVKSKDLGNEESPGKVQLGKVNLLQIILDSRLESEKGGPIPSIYNTSVEEKWGPIIKFLLGAGLKTEADDPSLVKYFYVACYQGNLDYVDRLLRHGVDINARAGRSDDRDQRIGSALHIAAQGGNKEVVSRLLNVGADVRARRKTCVGYSEEIVTPVEAALKPYTHHVGPEKCFDACETIVEAGADAADRKLLIEQCAKTGWTQMARRLLQKDVPGLAVPLCTDLEAIQLLMDHGATLDHRKFLEYATKEKSIELIEFLRERLGSTDEIEGALITIAKHSLFEYEPDIAKMKLIFKKYSNFMKRPKIMDQLLKEACQSRSSEAVHFLLQEGADPKCPSLEHTAAYYYQDTIKSYSLSTTHTEHIRIFQLLHVYSDKSRNVETYDPNELWMLPSQLPPECQTQPGREQASWNQRLRGNTTVEYARPEDFGDIQPNAAETGVQIVPADAQAEHFQYSDLDGLFAIRLVVIEPSESRVSPIKCRLVDENLSNRPEYEALSYVRGDLTDKVDIFINEKRFSITKSLWSVLCRLRATNKERIFWVDAICINEGNLVERNHQVSLMRDIYTTANHLNVWIGEAADDSQLIFNHIAKWRQYRDDYQAGRTTWNDPWGESHLQPSHYSGELAEAFSKLSLRPWFFRTWAIQEIVLSKKATILCGEDSEDFKQLVYAAGFNSRDYDPLCGVSGPTHLLNILSVSSANWNKVLGVNKLCRATDPKDKVYGLLGLFDRQLIKIDYNLSVSEIYTAFTKVVLRETNKLQLYHWLGTQRQRQDLPSWVPDYSASIPTGILPLPSSLLARSPWNKVPKLKIEGSDLIVQGIQLETILTIGDELVADPLVPLESEGFKALILQWETLALAMPHRRFSRAVPDVFMDTLVAHNSAGASGPPEAANKYWSSSQRFSGSGRIDGFRLWYEQYGAGPLKQADPRYFAEAEVAQAWQDPNSSAPALERFTHDFASVCYGRRFFTTDKGSMGLAPPRARPGDEIVFFPEGSHPFAVRPRGDGAFTLVGDCFLYDCDDKLIAEGHAREAVEDRVALLKEFVLR